MIRAVMAGAFVLLAACDGLSGGNQADRSAAAAPFPIADRPVAPIVSNRWSSEEARDRVNEAEDIMDRAGIHPGMTVADIGAGEGYYTVRLAARVGEHGRVLAEDIMPEVIEALSRRITREKWDNVSVKLGAPEDPRLPVNSFDRILMVHMYHEIAEPYAFLWHLGPALKKDGELIVVDADRPAWHPAAPARLRTGGDGLSPGGGDPQADGGRLSRPLPPHRRAPGPCQHRPLRFPESKSGLILLLGSLLICGH